MLLINISFFRIEGNVNQITQTETLKNSALNTNTNNKQISGNIYFKLI